MSKTLARTLALLASVLVLTACGTTPAAATPATVTTSAPPHTQTLSTTSALQISEIMYNPPDAPGVDGSELEFLELVNTSSAPVDLNNARFSDGIDYIFPNNAQLAPGAYWVLARSATAFAARYGFTPDGTYSGQLNNDGEQLTLIAADGAVLAAVHYATTAPWPLAPNGFGFSLVPGNGQRDPDDGAQWRASRDRHGSPGQPDPTPTTPRIVINEILAHTDLPQVDSVELFNPTEAGVDLAGWYMTDDRREPTKFRFGAESTIAPGGYLVVTADALGFAFSELGEEVALIAADSAGEWTGYDHTVVFAASPNGVSFGRHTTSTGAVHYPLQAEVTLGAANTAPRVGPVVISAVNFRPSRADDAYVEVTNITATAVPLFDPRHVENRWRLQGIGDDLLPAGIYLNAGAAALIVADDPTAFRNRHSVPPEVQIFGPFDGSLARDGELLELLQPGPPNADDGIVPYIVVDAVAYTVDAPWPPPVDDVPIARRDLSAYGNDPANWMSALPEQVFLPWLAQTMTR